MFPAFDPLITLAVVLGLGIGPFVALMATSFTKIVVVLSLLRNALGLQQSPPNMVLNGIAMILTIYIMAPIFGTAFDTLMSSEKTKSSVNQISQVVVAIRDPLQEFLVKHTHQTERKFFLDATKTLWTKEAAAKVSDKDFVILLPAFVTSELTEAFQIGFILFLAFIVVDLVIANILLALGMSMISPTTISLPFKILLFISLDGWSRLLQGLALSYK